MLDFRARMHCAAFAMDAFLKLPEAEQLRGWQHFTAGTRENFMAEVERGLETLTVLKERMTGLPETKRTTLSGAAAMSADAKRQVGGAESAHLPFAPPQARPKPAAPPTPVEYMAGERVLGFFSQALQSRITTFLSKKTLAEVLGNGHDLDPILVEKTVLDGLRAAKAVWRAAPDAKDPPKSAFTMRVSRLRYELGDPHFDQLLHVISKRDTSSDPINLSGLL
jgi:hypothetical protein